MIAIFAKYINTESILTDLNGLNLSHEEHIHLTSLIDTSLHHVILDEILSSLSPQDKKIFLHHLQHSDEDKVVDFLNSQINNIKSKIKKVTDQLVEELHRDIVSSKVKII